MRARPLRPTPRLGRAALAAAAVLAALLAGCGTTPRPGAAPPYERDGALPNPPADLEKVPDAEPRVEPIRSGGANKPYEVDGRRYAPETRDAPLRERGLASWYGRKFHGRMTATGERYDMYAMSAAHPTMPLPSYARVRNPANGREVIVRVNDRGPFHPGRVIDLSYTAALRLGLLRGVGIVEVERITNEDIRSGAWRGGREGTALAQAAKPAAPGAEPAATVAKAALPAMVAKAALPAVAAVTTGNVTTPDAQARPSPPTTASATASSAATDDAQPADAPPAREPTAASTAIATAPTVETMAATTTTSAADDRAGVAEREPAALRRGAAPGWWIQLGAFRQRAGAESFRRRVAAELGWIAPLLAVVDEPALHRLQAGPYASRDEAGGAAERLREALKLVPVLVERR